MNALLKLISLFAVVATSSFAFASELGTTSCHAENSPTPLTVVVQWNNGYPGTGLAPYSSMSETQAAVVTLTVDGVATNYLAEFLLSNHMTRCGSNWSASATIDGVLALRFQTIDFTVCGNSFSKNSLTLNPGAAQAKTYDLICD